MRGCKVPFSFNSDKMPSLRVKGERQPIFPGTGGRSRPCIPSLTPHVLRERRLDVLRPHLDGGAEAGKSFFTTPKTGSPEEFCRPFCPGSSRTDVDRPRASSGRTDANRPRSSQRCRSVLAGLDCLGFPDIFPPTARSLFGRGVVTS